MTKSLGELRNQNKKYAKIHLFLNRDQDKLSEITKISRNQCISQSGLRLLGLDIDVKTKSKNVDPDFLTVKTNFLKMSRFSQLSRQTF